MSPHGTPADEERSHTRVADDPPFQLTLVNVDVAAARNCAEVDAIMVNVLVVEAEAPKITDWVPPPVPDVFKMVRLYNAEEPVSVPDSVCCADPFR